VKWSHRPPLRLGHEPAQSGFDMSKGYCSAACPSLRSRDFDVAFIDLQLIQE
jgi:hypothetical protein